MRRFGPAAAVLVATGVDVGLLLALQVGAGWPVVAADAVALAVAAPVSYLLHRVTDRGADPFVRWVRDPRRFAARRPRRRRWSTSPCCRSSWSGSTTTPAAGRCWPPSSWPSPSPPWSGSSATAGSSSAPSGPSRPRPAHRPPPPGDRRLTVVLPAYHQPELAAEAVTRIREAHRDRGRGPATSRSSWSTTGRGTTPRPGPRPPGPTRWSSIPRTGGRVRRCAPVLPSPGGGRSPSPTPTWPTSPTTSLVLLERVEEGWDVAVGQPPAHRRGDPGPGPSPPGGRWPGHQPAHPGRAARPLPGHPVRAEGLPGRRRPGRARPGPRSTASPSTSSSSTSSSATGCPWSRSPSRWPTPSSPACGSPGTGSGWCGTCSASGANAAAGRYSAAVPDPEAADPVR